MKQTTEAIVLGLRKHSDKMSVLHVYSRSEGRLALQVYGAHSKHKVRAAYQPLSIVEITYTQPPTRSVPALSAIDTVFLPEKIVTDIRRQSVALFVTEILLLTVTHPMQDDALYGFLDAYVHELNDTSVPENMHLFFLVRMADYLGIGMPQSNADASETEDIRHASLSRHQRKKMLQEFCDYYLTHIDSFRFPKSLDVLTEIFN